MSEHNSMQAEIATLRAQVDALTAKQTDDHWKLRAADDLADAVAAMVTRRQLDSRSLPADALLNYRNPPRTDRSDYLASREAEWQAVADKERERAEKAEAERDEARRRLFSAAGDDLCRLTQEEIKAMSAGAVRSGRYSARRRSRSASNRPPTRPKSYTNRSRARRTILSRYSRASRKPKPPRPLLPYPLPPLAASTAACHQTGTSM